MKKIRVFGDRSDIKCEEIDGLATTERMYQITGEDIEASDGYHTFKELYDHRITLYIALCKSLRSDPMRLFYIWRSKLHADGSSYDGWFILGINTAPGHQITYHLPLDRWDQCDFAETLERGPEWDGHTSADVLERIKNL